MIVIYLVDSAIQHLNKRDKIIRKSRYATNLIINGVKFGEQDAIDQTRVFTHRIICQSLVKLFQLIHCLVTNQSLSNEENQVWIVELDQLKQIKRE